MTIALGILCRDGAVVAADTQETTGDAKVACTKIMAAQNEERATCLITGAGTSLYLDEGMSRLAATTGSERDTTNWPELLQSELQNFHEEYILPIVDHYPSDQHPILELIVCTVDRAGTGQLYLGNQQLLTKQSKGCGAIGSGAAVARHLLEQYGADTFDLDVVSAERLAVFAIQRAKNQNLYCGLKTDLCRVRRGQLGYEMGGSRLFAHPDYVRTLEQLFDDWTPLNRALFYHIVHGESYEGPEASAQIEKLRIRFDELDRTNWRLPPQTRTDPGIA